MEYEGERAMTALKRCPFCGSEEICVDEIGRGYLWLTCEHCDCSGPVGTNPKEARALWNRRANEERH